MKSLALAPLRKISTLMILSPCAIFCTTSMPFTTLPKAEWTPSSQGASLSVMKNWQPFVLGPALAMETMPGPSCFVVGENSSANS